MVHFEIHADDVERAKAFYATVFGWTFEDYGYVTGGTYWGVRTGPQSEPGIDGGLLHRAGAHPASTAGANAFVATVGVADYDETERRILAAGGEVVVPKAALTAMAWQGYYRDTEGNTFGVHQPDPEAA
ncbi:VOC family protein [Thalassiella azotivora]